MTRFPAAIILFLNLDFTAAFRYHPDHLEALTSELTAPGGANEFISDASLMQTRELHKLMPFVRNGRNVALWPSPLRGEAYKLPRHLPGQRMQPKDNHPPKDIRRDNTPARLLERLRNQKGIGLNRVFGPFIRQGRADPVAASHYRGVPLKDGSGSPQNLTEKEEERRQILNDLLKQKPVTSMPSLDDGQATGILAQIKGVVQQVMIKNNEIKSLDKSRKSETKEGSEDDNVWSAIEDASGVGKGAAKLKNVRDAITGELLVESCEIKKVKTLGMGGFGVVFLVVSLNQRTSAALGGLKEFALKALYANIDEKIPQPKRDAILENMFSTAWKGETDSLNLIGQGNEKVELGSNLSASLGAAFPRFTAELGSSAENNFFTSGQFAVYKRVLLSEAMLGDGDMLNYVSRRNAPVARLPLLGKEYVCMRMIQSVAAFHVQGACHRDIKPANFLVRNDGMVMLADLGLAGHTGEYRRCQNGLTPLFMDPEHGRCFIRNGVGPLNEKYDVWSVGMSCFMLFTDGRVPWGLFGSREIEQNIAGLETPCTASAKQCRIYDARENTPAQMMEMQGVPNVWIAIVDAMLSRNRTTRPSLRQIVARFPTMPLVEK